MNLKAIALASILGVSAPAICASQQRFAIADIALSTHAIAQPNAPLSMFSDGEWSVTIDYKENAFSYHARNMRTGDTLSLRGAKVSGDSQRRIYTWNNGDYRYQVAWQPGDPGVIRLQVFDGRGRETLNRLLYKSND
jgi:hypothetical protein